MESERESEVTKQWSVNNLEAGVYCQFVNSGLTQASYILFFIFLLEFGSTGRDRQDVSVYGCMCIIVLIPVYHLYNLIFCMPITKGLDK
jgi:hypothetical protein